MERHGTRYRAVKKKCKCDECRPVAKRIAKETYRRQKARKAEKKAREVPATPIPKAQVIHAVPEEPPPEHVTAEAVMAAMEEHAELERAAPPPEGIKAADNPGDIEEAVMPTEDVAPPLAARERGAPREMTVSKGRDYQNDPPPPPGALQNTQRRGGILQGVEPR